MDDKDKPSMEEILRRIREQYELEKKRGRPS
jgi:hypothetical protein